MNNHTQTDGSNALGQSETPTAVTVANKAAVNIHDVLADIESQIDANEVAMLPIVQSTGRSHFNPNTNPNREVVVFDPIEQTGLLYIKRTSKHEGEGGTIDGKVVCSVFTNAVYEADHKAQALIILSNGVKLIGYLTKSKTRNGIYLPKPFLPEGFILPELGSVLPIKVIKLIVG